MRYRLSPVALRDLDDAWFYIAQDNPRAADRFLDGLGEKLSMLAVHPELGRQCRELGPDLHRFPVGAYIIFYRIGAAHVEIVRILHGARDIENILAATDDL
jgi:toxin ParE1/3/4